MSAGRLPIPALLLAPVLAGCIATTPVKITDHNVFQPSARVSIQLSGEPEVPSRPHDGAAFEFSVTGGNGSDGQSLAAGALPVVVGGQTFTGPQQLNHKFEFRYVESVYRLRLFLNDALGFEGLIGLGYASFDLTTTAPGRRATEDRGDGGFAGGIGGLWRVLPSTSLQARVSFFESFGDISEDDGISARRIDIHAVQAFGRNVALRAGWSDWKLKSKNSPNSEIKARFYGPALGLELMF